MIEHPGDHLFVMLGLLVMQRKQHNQADEQYHRRRRADSWVNDPKDGIDEVNASGPDDEDGVKDGMWKAYLAQGDRAE